MDSRGLHKVAQTIGWSKVNDEADYSSYEYKRQISPKESVVNVVRIYNSVTLDEFLETLYIIKNVLPKKLQRRVNKVTGNLKPEDISGALDAVCFAIEEYRSKCAYTKLYEYGMLVGVDLKEIGYGFQYELPRKVEKQILTQIESKLPMKYATELAKMKKMDYKIGYLKTCKNFKESE